MSEQSLLLLDANSLINRAFYGLFGRQNLTAPDGTPTGALFAFFNIYLKLIEELEPTHVVAAFDRREPTFRHKLYEEYKGTRKPMPDELAVQIPILKELLDALGVCCLEKAGYEADDLIGTLSARVSDKMPVTIVSGDKDIFQLVDQKITVLQPVTRSGMTETRRYDPEAIKERYQVNPKLIIDIKALMGDPSDNIPGVRGIGEKTALALVRQYGSIESIYQSLSDIKPSVAKKLEAERDMAFLSKKLVTIERDMPIDQDLEHVKLKGIDQERLSEALTRLGFKTILDRLGFEPVQATLSDEKSQVKPAACQDLLEDLEGGGNQWIPLFLHPDKPMAWIDGEDTIRVLNETDPSSAWEAIVDSNANFFVYDLKKWLRETGRSGSPGHLHDILIAAYLLNQLDGKPDLERLYQRVTGSVWPKTDSGQESSDDRQQSFFEEERTSKSSTLDAEDVVCLRAINQIGRCQRDKIKSHDIEFLADSVEFPLISILADMEQRGFSIDREFLSQLSCQMQEQLENLQEKIFQLAKKEFNINSPRQLSVVLFEDLGLKTGKRRSGGAWSTDADELERLSDDHPIIPLILDYRQTSKLRATFVEGLIKAIDPEDGRVHTTFNQALTSTGRLSSSDPNLQNIPIRTAQGRQIRQAFIARSGHVLIDADYSQIELRLLAHLSQDPAMIEAFVQYQDIHTDTACRIFGLSPEAVTSEMRAIAKTMNFSIVYGISDYGLARDLGVSVRQAHRWITEYEARYPRIRAYLDHLVDEADEKGYAETLFGRRRYISQLKSSNRNIRQFGERAAMNTPIQGTAADLIKIAMVKVNQALRKADLKARLILQVHDELIVEAPVDEAEEAGKLLKDAMESAMKLDVPLVAEVCQANRWSECKISQNDVNESEDQ